VQSEYLEREAWFVLQARRPGVSARELAAQYGMEELRAYIDRSRREIDDMRGHPFGERSQSSSSGSRSMTSTAVR
jgi:hypothetical protein